MPQETSASKEIVGAVSAWPGVVVETGSRGELSIGVEGREIGHLHGDRVAHFGFPRSTWSALLAEGRIAEHPYGGDGWGARALRAQADIDDTIALMRLNYDRAVARTKARRVA